MDQKYGNSQDIRDALSSRGADMITGAKALLLCDAAARLGLVVQCLETYAPEGTQLILDMNYSLRIIPSDDKDPETLPASAASIMKQHISDAIAELSEGARFCVWLQEVSA